MPATTIGQRRGLGVADGQPLYVTRRDAAANTITVGGKAYTYTRSSHQVAFSAAASGQHGSSNQ